MFGNVVVMTTFEGYLIINLPVSISGIQIIREIEEIRSYYERIWSAHSWVSSLGLSGMSV